MPDDVKLWLQYGGASTAAEDALAKAPAADEFPSEEDALEALDAAADTQAEEAAAPARLTLSEEPEAPPHTACFVHFIPPPMRENGKKELAWIVHTCDGSGCREAKHVTFNSICGRRVACASKLHALRCTSITVLFSSSASACSDCCDPSACIPLRPRSGFSTFEGAPPEQAEGRACSCAIANHHLRGFGKPRWEGDHAIIEHHGGGNVGFGAAEAGGGGGGGAMVNVKAYREQARKQASQLGRAREEIKKLRALREEMTRQLDAAIASQDEAETTCAKEITLMKARKTTVEERYRLLLARYDALKTEHDASAPAASKLANDAATSPLKDGKHGEGEATDRGESLDAEAEAAKQQARQWKLGLGPWQCFVVCLPATAPAMTARGLVA